VCRAELRPRVSQTIVITGGAGFAGRHLVDFLAQDDTSLIAWHRPGSRPPVGTRGTVWQPVDILDRAAVEDAIGQERPAAVYHCAGAAHVGRSWDDTELTFAVNVRGTHHLLEAVRRCGSETRVLIPSSAMIYRPSGEPLSEDDPVVPTSPYGLSKLAQELLGQRASTGRTRVLIARAFNHVGPRQDPSFAASGFAKQIAEIEIGRRDPEVAVGNLDAKRDTIDVRDTVRAYRTILEHGRPGRAYNISSGRAVVVGDMLEMLRSRARVPIRVRVDSERFRPHDIPTLVGNSTRLRTELGWAPTIPLERTIEDLLTYWRAALQSPPD
jgi:GDP-4-dehydro-6-deoxy-D-mannose reductase